MLALLCHPTPSIRARLAGEGPINQMELARNTPGSNADMAAHYRLAISPDPTFRSKRRDLH
jgi:hypothetical protein